MSFLIFSFELFCLYDRITCKSGYHMHALCKEISEEGVTSPGLELWSVVSYHQGAENQNWVFFKNKCTKLMSISPSL